MTPNPAHPAEPGASGLASEIELVVRREHADPHHVLGAHPSNGGVVVRAFRPAAERVLARVDGGEPVTLEQRHPAGLFEGTLDGAELPLRYELEVSYPDGNTFTLLDPYAFPPTVGELDLHLAAEGRHEEIYERLGAHVRELEGVTGTAFAVWAPAAKAVSVVGEFNSWDGRLHPMRSLGTTGVWEIFLPGVEEGAAYKYEILAQSGEIRMKADPFALAAQHPPRTDSVVHRSRHRWGDAEWMERRRVSSPHAEPVSIYEVHLGSWRLNPLEGNRSLSYAELADELAAYVTDMGFTHVELLPVMEHPFSGSWGYQVSGYFAPTARHGDPDDFRALVDRLHQAGIGVILDWVPAHFPRDDWALARFDGTALYEHEDPRRGAHPEWGTLIFNYGRNEVRNFLLSSALFWPREYHADGLRVDAVASMLYLDYSRAEGAWVPNEYGGNEDLDAVGFLKELNGVIHRREPGILSVAEESTAWPGVSRPTYLGGLGFGFKWNMGWMHDTLDYFQRDPVHRRFHHHQLTFSLMYAFSENFVLPLSHDEVVHGKGSLYSKMAGDRWQKLANLRSLYAYMWAHPGKKLLFMGGELAQEAEWSHERSLDWHLLEDAGNAGVQALVRDLNGVLRSEPALYEQDFDPAGFWWLEANDAAANVLAFARASSGGERVLVCAANLAPVPRPDYRLGLPRAGRWREVMNTDSSFYGGTDTGNLGGIEAEPVGWHEQPFSAEVTLPPLGVVWLVPE
ncbi:MAG: 1,4-alpha-glucan branching protein GlgB [Thermoleophilaceae bacterium]